MKLKVRKAQSTAETGSRHHHSGRSTDEERHDPHVFWRIAITVWRRAQCPMQQGCP